MAIFLACSFHNLLDLYALDVYGGIHDSKFPTESLEFTGKKYLDKFCFCCRLVVHWQASHGPSQKGNMHTRVDPRSHIVSYSSYSDSSSDVATPRSSFDSGYAAVFCGTDVLSLDLNPRVSFASNPSFLIRIRFRHFF